MKKSNKVKLIGSILLIIDILLIFLFRFEKNVEISKYNYECIYCFIPICFILKVYCQVHVCVCVCLVAQSCPTLWDNMDCSPPGSSVHGIPQAREYIHLGAYIFRIMMFFSLGYVMFLFHAGNFPCSKACNNYQQYSLL